MQSMELPLVIFTVLSQAAAGIAMMSLACQVTGPNAGETKNEWPMVAALMAIGLVASLFHLGHPMEALRAFAHLEKSWLSREVLAGTLFIVLAVIAVITARKSVSIALVAVTALIGLVMVVASGMTYAPAAMPAINNMLPTVFFLISAVILGAGFASWFAGEASQPMLARIFSIGLVVGLVVSFTAPSIWIAGSEVMRMTGQAWFGSGLYWLHLAILAASLVVIFKSKTIPVWLPIVVLLGELLGRAAFFADTIHTAANMGAPY